MKKGDLLPLSAEYLQHKRFHFLQDSQDINAACESLGVPSVDVTGMLADVGAGEYIEVWSTGYLRSWRLDAVYECVLARARQPGEHE